MAQFMFSLRRVCQWQVRSCNLSHSITRFASLRYFFILNEMVRVCEKVALVVVGACLIVVWSPVTASPYDLGIGRPHLTLYDHENHRGERYYQDVGPKCYNLPKVFDNRASSLDTHHGCVRVCTQRDCTGCYNMRPGTRGHFALKEIHLNDNVSSFTQCF